MGTFKAQLKTGLDKAESESERRLLSEDFKRSMKQVGEYLMLRFREQEDIKNAVRDSFSYIKLYTPLMT